MLYRKEIPPLVCQRQLEALNATICILQSFGPTGFLLQEENQAQKVKVLIGAQHSCSCKTFAKDKDLCKHICWVLLRKFRIDKYDPSSWQLGLNDIEITNLLRKVNEKEPVPNQEEPADPTDEDKTDQSLAQRPIASEDICPICQEEFLSEKRPPVTFCRMGCGNNVHMKCMRLWKDHQAKKNDKGDTVFCPMCRGVFAKLGDLVREFAAEREKLSGRSPADSASLNLSASIGRQFELSTRHSEAVCCRCTASPLYGRVYKIDSGQKMFQEENQSASHTVSEEKMICEKCYRRGSEDHTVAFLWREEPTGKWRNVPQNLDHLAGFRLPPGGVSGDETAQQRPNDAWATTRPLSLGELSRISRWALRMPKVSAYRKNAGAATLSHRILGLLTPGRQCRICLMHFQLGDEVRRLPGCGHVFHAACIDPWLLHTSPCCPLDKTFSVPSAPSLQEKELKLNVRHSHLRQKMGLEPSLKLAEDALHVSGLHMNFGSSTTEAKKNGMTREEPFADSKVTTIRTNSAKAFSRAANKHAAAKLHKTSETMNSNPPPMEIGGSRLYIGRLPSSAAPDLRL